MATYKAKAASTKPDELVFTTKAGTPRDRGNARTRVLAYAIERANRKRAAAACRRSSA